jgi:hypothetical protein
MGVYSHIASAFVDGKIPDLEVGEYRLEVRTRPSGRRSESGSTGG